MEHASEASSSGQEALLDSYCLLAKSSKGPACASLVNQVLEHPGIFVFGELLDMPNVQELAGTSAESVLELLKVFAYGTWSDYRANVAQLPQLSEAQILKLKKLTVVTLASESKSIQYEKLLHEIELSSVRQLEDLLIECIYGGLIQGKLDQQKALVEITYCAGRDVHPSEVQAMCEKLASWHKNSVELMSCISSQLEKYKGTVETARKAQAEIELKVEAVKATLRAQQETGEGYMGAADFDGGMDYEDDKMRKGGGRAKNKHAMGIAGSRK